MMNSETAPSCVGTSGSSSKTTMIRFAIGPDGKMTTSQVVRSSGPSREHKMLDRVALSKLSGCTFTAGIDENGRAMGASFDVAYVWKLE